MDVYTLYKHLNNNVNIIILIKKNLLGDKKNVSNKPNWNEN